jgi:hypothetical protein
MNTSLEDAVFKSKAGDSEQVARLRSQVSLLLTRAQKELHDAIFTLDGSEESLDRFASARAELDSAEAWALHVAKTLPHRHSS